MKLKLKQLQNIVKDAVNQEKNVEALKIEAKRVLGPILDVNVKLVDLAESINDRVDVLELTGRQRNSFKTSTIIKFMKHKHPEVRSMAARLVPESYMNSMNSDPSSKVRMIVAKRASLNVVKEMMKKFPNDDQIRMIYSQRHRELNEGSENDDFLHIYDEEALGDAGKTYDINDDDLSETWYENKARELYADHTRHGEIDVNWNRIVNAFCENSRATSLVEINKKKLSDAINTIIKDKDDKLIGETFDRFDFQVLKEHSSILAFPVIEELIDPVGDILNETHDLNKVDKIKDLFKITETKVSASIKRSLIGESYRTNMVPNRGMLPHKRGIRFIDEQALDLFVESWNSRQIAKYEPFKISWNQDPANQSVIIFTLDVR